MRDSIGRVTRGLLNTRAHSASFSPLANLALDRKLTMQSQWYPDSNSCKTMSNTLQKGGGGGRLDLLLSQAMKFSPSLIMRDESADAKRSYVGVGSVFSLGGDGIRTSLASYQHRTLSKTFVTSSPPTLLERHSLRVICCLRTRVVF